MGKDAAADAVRIDTLAVRPASGAYGSWWFTTTNLASPGARIMVRAGARMWQRVKNESVIFSSPPPG